jgi:hypothetical protein
MMSIMALERILKPPAGVQTGMNQDRWAEVEAQLGTTLPRDYKTFVEVFGLGSINGFLVVFVPYSLNPHVDLLTRGRTELTAYETLKASFPTYYSDSVYPTVGGILPFAGTDNGNILYWRTIGHPDEWTITVYEGGPEHFEFNGGMTAFLAAILSGEIRCKVLPADFVESPPFFEPIDIILAKRNRRA